MNILPIYRSTRDGQNVALFKPSSSNDRFREIGGSIVLIVALVVIVLIAAVLAVVYNPTDSDGTNSTKIT
ncbi:MAG: hypothetical protein S4CHLAM45_13890 [Chlamydiales bacterium]|nr:hypothetical protein [Chlamydiales bacterium]MCH9623479.1 hypothetical protein [Chlamydiales bacterium]